MPKDFSKESYEGAVPVDRKYGDLADHHEILKRLQKLIDLMEEKNDIMLYDVGGCCSGCDGTCGEED